MAIKRGLCDQCGTVQLLDWTDNEDLLRSHETPEGVCRGGNNDPILVTTDHSEIADVPVGTMASNRVWGFRIYQALKREFHDLIKIEERYILYSSMRERVSWFIEKIEYLHPEWETLYEEGLKCRREPASVN